MAHLNENMVVNMGLSVQLEYFDIKDGLMELRISGSCDLMFIVVRCNHGTLQSGGENYYEFFCNWVRNGVSVCCIFLFCFIFVWKLCIHILTRAIQYMTTLRIQTAAVLGCKILYWGLCNQWITDLCSYEYVLPQFAQLFLFSNTPFYSKYISLPYSTDVV